METLEDVLAELEALATAPRPEGGPGHDAWLADVDAALDRILDLRATR